MSTGSGHSQFEEAMSVLGVPVMTKKSFINTERDIGEEWKKQLLESMSAGKEEKRLAEENEDYYQGVPAISVIVEGG